MKTMTRTLLTRLGLMAAAVLLTTLPAQAQWTVEDAHEGTSDKIIALPDGSLMTVGTALNSQGVAEWLARWKDPETGWTNVDDLRDDAETRHSSPFDLAAAPDGSVYVVGFAWVNIDSGGKGHKTGGYTWNQVVRKGTYSGGQWNWKFVDVDPVPGGAEDVVVDANGKVYVFYNQIQEPYLIKESDDGGTNWTVIDTFNYDPNYTDNTVFGDHLALDAQGNLYVASTDQKVVNTYEVPNSGHGKKNQGTTTVYERENFLVIRKYDAQARTWSTIEERRALDSGSDTIGCNGMTVTPDDVVVCAVVYGNTNSTGRLADTWEVSAGTEIDGQWVWLPVDTQTGRGEYPEAIGQSPDGTVYVVGRLGGDNTGLPEEGLIRSSADLLNWNEEVLLDFSPLDLAFQGGSLYLSGGSLTTNDVDVVSKALP